MDSILGIGGLTPGGLGIWGILLYLVAWSLKEYRASKKLSLEDRQANREGFTKQVESLQNENRALRHELSEKATEYDDYRRLCQHETDQLRAQVRGLEDMVVGLTRRLDAFVGVSLRTVSAEPNVGISLAGLTLPPRTNEGAEDE